MKPCPDCNGDGVVEKGTDDEQQCPTCGGSGFVPDDDVDAREEVIKTVHGANYNGGNDVDRSPAVLSENSIRAGFASGARIIA